jgi:peroxiredoxin
MKAAALVLGGVFAIVCGGPAPLSAASAPRAAAGAAAPDFALQSLDGRTVRLSDFKGKAVLLNFWATWCGPCRAEIPWLAELSKKYRGQGLEIVGVSMDEGDRGRARVGPFIQQRNVSYTILFGDESVAAAYDGVPVLPQTFIIGRDGRILGSVSGSRKKAQLELGAQAALGTGMPSGSASRD